MKNVWASIAIIFLIGCSNNFRYETVDGYRTTYHLVEMHRGEIFITSGFQSSVLEELPPEFANKKNFITAGEVYRNWANIALYQYKSNHECFNSTFNISGIVEQLFSESILPDSDIYLDLFFVPMKSFNIRVKSENNSKFNFFYPVDFCNQDELLYSLIKASNRIVHELYHVKVNLYRRLENIELTTQEEENNAYKLEFCNAVTAESRAVFNKDYFELDYDSERREIIKKSPNRVQKFSDLGRINAMESISIAFANDLPILDFCKVEIEKINQDTFKRPLSS